MAVPLAVPSNPPRRPPHVPKRLPAGRWMGRVAKLAFAPVKVAGYKFSVPDNRFLFWLTFPFQLLRILILFGALVITLVLLCVMLIAGVAFYLPAMALYSATVGITVETGKSLPRRLADAPAGSSPGGSPGANHQATVAAAQTLLSHLQRSYGPNPSGTTRPLMADGMWRVHQMLLTQRRSVGVSRTWDARVTSATVVSEGVRGTSQFATVRLHLEGRCFEHAGDTVLRGTPDAHPWTDTIVIRRSAAHAGAAASVAHTDQCANCGAPIDTDPTGVCPKCQTILAARPDQWVITDFHTEAW